MKSFFKLATLVAAFGFAVAFAGCSNGSDGTPALALVGGGTNPTPPTTPEQGGGQGEQPGGGENGGGSQTSAEVFDEDGFVVVEVTNDNITSVVANATKNTRLVFLENTVLGSSKDAIANSSVKFIFDFTKSTLTYIGLGFNVTNSNVVKLVFSNKIEEID